MKESIEYLNNLLKPNDVVVIGLSGGPDSMCLFDILLKLDTKVKIICAHINHNIREESKNEQTFLEDYCNRKKVKFITTTFEKKSETEEYNEAELREMRYKFFEKVVRKNHAKYLFTAHHGDDLIETILMRITRGSNLKGYSGFDLVTEKVKYKIIRPLIFSTKSDITEYNLKNEIPFFRDRTNDSDDYTRNRYRRNVLPFLKEENSNVHLKYYKFNNELNKYYEYVDKEVRKEISNRYHGDVLNITDFNQLDSLIQTKVIEFILDDKYPDNLYLVSDVHVENILNLIKSNKPNSSINLPDNLIVTKSYDKLIVSKNNIQSVDYDLEITDKITKLPNNHEIIMLDETEETSNYYIKLDSKELSLPLHIRSKKDGDRMIIKNMNGYKKLKDIYIDSKIPLQERNTRPILVDSKGNILWLPGIKKSKFAKANGENYDIILWYK
jgi:tRNA(Ile)-lysidine synthetase-like protein